MTNPNKHLKATTALMSVSLSVLSLAIGTLAALLTVALLNAKLGWHIGALVAGVTVGTILIAFLTAITVKTVKTHKLYR